MLFTSRAKHAQASLHPMRSTLSVGLTAVLLPLCLTAPGLPGAGTALAATSASVVAPAKLATVVTFSGPRGTVAAGVHAVAARLTTSGRPIGNSAIIIERSTARGWVYAGRVVTAADGVGRGRMTFASTTKLRAVYAGSANSRASWSGASVVSVVRVAPARAAAAGFRTLAVQVASQQNGKPYEWGSVGPNSFDCSGLIKYSFARAGKALPRTSGEMYSVSQKLSQSAKQPGDLIFMSTDGRIGHVGVYAGGGRFWDAPRAGKNVSLRPIWSTSYLVGRVN